ncbi:MAG: preprotein translocase subunit YajC [Pseudomonadota bacterium]
MRHFRKTTLLGLIAAAGALPAMPAMAQDDDDSGRGTTVQPYIEVNQVLSAELTPGDDLVTFTQIATGTDINTQGRNLNASVSIRYERNISYGDDAIDTDRVSGIARGSLTVVPRAVTLEAGALASRTRVDGGGGVSVNPLVAEDAESRIYSGYIGPAFATQLGSVDLTGNARVGYNRFETDNALFDANGDPIDVFDDSIVYSGQITAGTRPGDPLPVGVAVTAGGFQEDISNLDQRIRDVFVRGDVTIPLTENFAVVGGVGYEDVEVSSRDAVRDINGDPVRDANGRFVTDSSVPRQIAFESDGLIWDVGVVWNPSRRTSLSARVGERYGDTTYYGNLSYVPNSRSAFNVSVYDGLTGYGGALGTSLAGLSNDFQVLRDPITGDFGGQIADAGSAGLDGTLGSIRSAAFRNQGVGASYQRQIGGLTAAIGGGYNRREFIAAQGTVLEAIDGVTDENYYVAGALSAGAGRSGRVAANVYANWFDAGEDGGDVTAYGASAAYNRALTRKLSARAALGVDYIESSFTDDDFAVASALLGLRYDF